MVWDVTQHFLSFWRQIDAIHRNLITFVLLCLEWFERNWKFLIVLTSYRCNSSWFEHFCFAVFGMVWDVTQHFLSFWRQIDAIHRNLITFVLLCLDWFERNWKFLIVLTSNRCNSSWFEHFCFAVFGMVWDVTQHFWSFWRQIVAIHRDLITFVVLLCLEWFGT